MKLIKVKDKKNINKSISIAKGIGIILVVIGHSRCSKLLHDFIYLFHMSLFYFVSGYFFKEVYVNRKKEFVWKRIKGLYKPFLKYSLVFLFLHNIFFYFNIYSDSYGYNGNGGVLYSWFDIFKNTILTLRFVNTELLLGAFWFLRSLFVVNIMFCFSFWISTILSSLHKQKFILIIVLLVFIGGGVLNSYGINGPYSIVREFVVMSIFYLGYIYNKFEKYLKYNILFLPLLIIILWSCSSYIGTLEVGASEFINLPYFVFVSLVGSYMTMLISHNIKNKNFSNLLIWIGNKTIYILAFHFISFKIVSLAIILYFNYDIKRLASFPVIETSGQYWWILYSIIGVFIPLLFIELSGWVKSSFIIIKSKIMLN